MMLPLPLVRWLACAFLLDWLLTRTLTRSAIFMPKSPAVILVYQGLGLLGQFCAVLAGVLLLTCLIWLAGQGLRSGRGQLPALGLLLLAGLSVAFLFLPPQGWLSAGYHLLLLALIAWMGLRIGQAPTGRHKRLAGFMVALALLVSQAYLLVPVLSSLLRLSSLAESGHDLFLWGELLVVLSPIALWAAYACRAPRWTWLAAALPVLAFTGMRLAVPAMAGILAIWSTGLTLYLPWPLYALSLWAAGVTAIDCLRRGQTAGWAVLMLAAAGYTPQLSTQAILGLLALWLLAPADAPEPAEEQAWPALASSAPGTSTG